MASNNALAQSPNLDLNANHDGEIITTAAVLSSLSLMAILARIASRKIKNAPLGIDEALLIAAWVYQLLALQLYLILMIADYCLW